ncbi:IQ calmodulin-binding motif-containing protein [Iodobacter fluviatilis]|nr:hypothetical protein [Iodobacter fluviatilis]
MNKDVVGNYTAATTPANTPIESLTFFIEHGALLLIKKNPSSYPKIHEYCDNARIIFNALDLAKNQEITDISAVLQDNRKITILEVDGGVVFTDPEGRDSLCKGMTFQSIKEKLIRDSQDNPGFYGEEIKEKSQDEHPLKPASDGLNADEQYLLKNQAALTIQRTWRNHIDLQNKQGKEYLRELLACNGKVINSLHDLKTGDVIVIANSTHNEWNRHGLVAVINADNQEKIRYSCCYQLGVSSLSEYRYSSNIMPERSINVYKNGMKEDMRLSIAAFIDMPVPMDKLKYICEKGVLYKLESEFNSDVMERAYHQRLNQYTLHNSDGEEIINNKVYLGDNYNCNNFVYELVMAACQVLRDDRTKGPIVP